MIETLTRSW